MVGTSLGVPEKMIASARKQVENLLLKDDSLCEPNRGDLDDECHKWLHGKPDYSIANLEYLTGKSQNHKAGSLEKVVEDLVQTWEMEATHKQYKDWRNINHEEYYTQATVNSSVFLLICKRTEYVVL